MKKEHGDSRVGDLEGIMKNGGGKKQSGSTDVGDLNGIMRNGGRTPKAENPSKLGGIMHQ